MFGKTKINIGISGMTCRHCAKAVKTALEDLGGVVKADINLEKNCADVIVKKTDIAIAPEVFRQAIESAGYKIESFNN